MIWENLVRDPQVALGALEQNKHFRQFVEQDLPVLLEEIMGETLTLNRLMEAQHKAAAELAFRSIMNHRKFEGVANSLSQHEHADIFLDTLGISEEAYIQQQPGLTSTELEEYREGMLTVEDLLRRRPAVILGPFLRPKYLN